MAYKDICPQGGPVIGYTGFVDTRAPASIGRIATMCGKLAVRSSGSTCRPCSARVRLTTARPWSGTAAGWLWVARGRCAAGAASEEWTSDAAAHLGFLA